MIADGPDKAEYCLNNLYIYANRGAARAKSKNGKFVVDEVYGRAARDR